MPMFSFLSTVSSPSPTVDPVPSIEQSNPPTRPITNSTPVSPTANVLINNSIPFPTVYPESEGEHLRLTDLSRENIRPVASYSRHPNSQHSAKSVALYKQHRREHFASRARISKKPRFNRHLSYKLKPDFSSWEIIFRGWYSTRIYN